MLTVIPGYLIPRYGFRINVISGSLIMAIGFISTAFVPNVYCMYGTFVELYQVLEQVFSSQLRKVHLWLCSKRNEQRSPLYPVLQPVLELLYFLYLLNI